MDIPARRLPTDEGGEFELILGNRQLLSVFSSMVILLGVFFTMGYIVGSYSTPVAVADVNPKRKRETKPLVVESPGARPAEPAAAEPPRRKFASPAPITTAPLQPAETPKPPKNETVKSEPVESVKAEKSAPASGGAPSGTYLQPAARTKDEADIIVAALRQKKFAVITAKVPGNPGLFRVLWGRWQKPKSTKPRPIYRTRGSLATNPSSAVSDGRAELIDGCVAAQIHAYSIKKSLRPGSALAPADPAECLSRRSTSEACGLEAIHREETSNLEWSCLPDQPPGPRVVTRVQQRSY
jgi:hypothetical protein